MARVPIGKRDKDLSSSIILRGTISYRAFIEGFQDYGSTAGTSRGIIDPRYDISRGYNCRISDPSAI